MFYSFCNCSAHSKANYAHAWVMIELIHLSIYPFIFFMDIRFQFHKSNQQKVGSFFSVSKYSPSFLYLIFCCTRLQGIHVERRKIMAQVVGTTTSGSMRNWSHHHQECVCMWSTVEKHNGHTGHSSGVMSPSLFTMCHIFYIYIF